MLSSPMLTIHEVADLLKVTEATVRRWIKQKELVAVEFNREYRVARKHLEKFVTERLTIDLTDNTAMDKATSK